jgi:hypothetical protein
MVNGPARPDDGSMSNQWLSPRDDLDEGKSGPSLATIVAGGAAIAVGVLLLLGVVVPTAFWLLGLALPILLLVVGVRLLSKGEVRGVGRFAAWAATILGGLWLLDAIDLFNIGRFLFVGLLVAGAVYVGRRLVADKA